MKTNEHDEHPSPWHEGERTLQARHGVADRMESVGRRVIRRFMPDQHREFFARLPFVVVGSVDGEERPWATVIEGAPGFAHSPDPQHLVLAATESAGDPAWNGITDGSAVGVLGIELATRRRNRLNGRVRNRRPTDFTIEVEQSFGNCPQYIQRREPRGASARPDPGSAIAAERLTALDEAAIAQITGADTFFVASHADPGGDPQRRGVDVSHRGGRPGFVRVDGDRLTIPDFAGNLHFNTLGNLLASGRAGLAFVDFASGGVLQLSGRAEVLLDDPEIALFDGAERLWRLEIERAFRRPAALGMRLELVEASPRTLETGTWPRKTG
jgi:predicted pyridoxine 5'-phosphate oxidase superfamily flavin-nucleotide-binding protein